MGGLLVERDCGMRLHAAHTAAIDPGKRDQLVGKTATSTAHETFISSRIDRGVARHHAPKPPMIGTIYTIGYIHMRRLPLAQDRLLHAPQMAAAVLLTVLGLILAPAPASAAEIVVFAAASLKEALDEAVKLYDSRSGEATKISYAASSALAKQIESGAPADLFVSADLDWMDYLQKRGLIQPATRKNLLGNRLVIAAPADTGLTLDIKPGFDLAGALKGGHLSMADPDSVPAGKYGKAALQKLGVWNSVEGAVVRAENVRAALLFV